ncbi:MAG: hypothetical protein ACJ798_12520 [Phenylobacterium sp.]
MALYTFYFCNRDGTSASFETFELADDLEAAGRAATLLNEHLSCAYVAIWCGERIVGRRERERPLLAADRD